MNYFRTGLLLAFISCCLVSCCSTVKANRILVEGTVRNYKLFVGDELGAAKSCSIQLLSIEADYVKVLTTDGVTRIHNSKKGGITLSCNLRVDLLEINHENNFVIVSAVKKPRPSLFFRLLGPPF